MFRLLSNGHIGGILIFSLQPLARQPQALGSSAIMQGVTSLTTSTSVSSGTIPQPPPGTISTVRPATGPMMLMTQATPGMIQQTIPRPAVAGELFLSLLQ